MIRYIELEQKYPIILDRLINLLGINEDMDLLEHILRSNNVPQGDWQDLVELALFKMFK